MPLGALCACLLSLSACTTNPIIKYVPVVSPPQPVRPNIPAADFTCGTLRILGYFNGDLLDAYNHNTQVARQCMSNILDISKRLKTLPPQAK